MINTLTLIALLKPTAAFVFNFKRLSYLLTVPVSILTAVLAAAYFFPVVSLAETVEVRLHINFYTLSAIAFFFIFLPVSVMRRTQELLFFGEASSTARVFWPEFDRLFLKCVSMCFLLFFFSVVSSVVLMAAFFVLAGYFIGLPDQTDLFLWSGLFLLSPYFCVRFILKLPSIVAGRSLGWWPAWKLTGRIGIMMMALFAMFLFMPTMIVAIAYFFTGKVAGAELFWGTFGVSSAVLFSTVLFSAYCGYLYTYATSKA